MQKARGQAFRRIAPRHSPPTACRHTVSGYYFTPLTGVLFTFPSRYWFTIGRQGVFSLTRWSSWILTGFHVSRDTQDTRREPASCRLPGCHRLWPIVPDRSTTLLVCHSRCDGPYNPTVQARWFGLFRVRSPLLAESLLFSVPGVLRWFTSLRCLRTAYGFSGGSSGISQRGFPHSEIPGSKLVCSSPGLIAAYRVLHRLLAPRHSPYTLSSLTIRNSNLRLHRHTT